MAQFNRLLRLLRRVSAWPALLLVGLLAAPGGSAPAAGVAVRPNILVLIADDLGWGDVGYHDSEIRTACLDRLARDGVRLDSHYVFPTCSPTRAALLTGSAPSRWGILNPIGGRSEQTLPPEAPLLPRLLQGAGYSAGLIGKWHLGLTPATGPNAYGFQESYGYLHGQIDPYTLLYKNGDLTWHRNGEWTRDSGHVTDLLAGEAVRRIQSMDERPFYMQVAFSVPHYPLQEDAAWTGPYSTLAAPPSRRLYAAAVTHMDAAIDRILAALRRSGRERDTLVLFTSDNGAQQSWKSVTDYGGKFQPQMDLGKNLPLRGWKGQLYEGGIRVPALVSWPGKLQARQVDGAIAVVDWLPTFCRLAGAALPAALDGEDAWPLLTGARKQRTTPIYWRDPHSSAVREGDWKLIRRDTRPPGFELYNLATDPREARDLSAREPARSAALQRLLAGQAARDR